MTPKEQDEFVRQGLAEGLPMPTIAAQLGVRTSRLEMRLYRQRIAAQRKCEEEARLATERRIKILRDTETARVAADTPFEAETAAVRAGLIDINEKFQALLLRAGATYGVCTTPGTENPVVMTAERAPALRSGNGWMA